MDKDLKQIAVDLYEGRIFTDRHLDDPKDVGMVFMPIMLGAFSGKTEEELKKIGLVYEYLSEAGPRSVNGMPMFYSCKILDNEETKIMFNHYDRYKIMKEEFDNK
jgi:hypothetical protein